MIIRSAITKDIDIICKVESSCFPEAESCKKEEFIRRVKYFGNHFLLLIENDKLVSFINGMVTDNRDLTDDMYSHAEDHNEFGKWQMIFGINTISEYRNKGYASLLIKRFIEDAKSQGREGVVLTCKDKLISFYEKFGFVNEGISSSAHGNALWYQMRLTF